MSAMPTFIFYKNKVKIDSQRGADPNALEEKIKKWYGPEGDDEGDEVVVKGHVSNHGQPGNNCRAEVGRASDL